MLIASKLEDGLVINLKGKITSRPYLEMTLSLLDKIGIKTEFLENTITIKPNVKEITETTLVVESDWSSASYFYSIVALSDVGAEIKLSSYKNDSLQGDSVLSKIYEDFGVETTYINNTILLKKTNKALPSKIEIQLNEAPDIAQTIAITCLGLGISCHLTGLHTLKIKETDRLSALKIEIEKLGTPIEITEDTLTISRINAIKSDVLIDTYQDHRMAMAFARLALKTSIEICDVEVVSKSYPDFWKDLKAIGFQISK